MQALKVKLFDCVFSTQIEKGSGGPGGGLLALFCMWPLSCTVLSSEICQGTVSFPYNVLSNRQNSAVMHPQDNASE